MVCFKVGRVKSFERLNEVFDGFNALILKKVYALPVLMTNWPHWLLGIKALNGGPHF